MSKKVIAVVTADWHLNSSNIEQKQELIGRVLDIASEHDCTNILGLGDFFHQRKSQELTSLSGFDTVLQLFSTHSSHNPFTLYAIPGNHDKVNYKSYASYLDAYRHFPNFKLYRESTVVQIDNINFTFLPFFEDELFINGLRQCIDEVCIRGGGRKNVLITHQAIDGVSNNDGRVVENSLKRELFDVFDLVLVGHYHNRSELTKKIHYIGSLNPDNFGEDEQKGCVLLYEDLSLEYINLEFKRYHKYYFDLDTANKKEIDDFVATLKPEEEYIRLILSGSPERLKTFDCSELEARGIDVQLKQEDAEQKDLEATEFKVFTKGSLMEEWQSFSDTELTGYSESELMYGHTLLERSLV